MRGEDKVVDLMAALEQSVQHARAARRRHGVTHKVLSMYPEHAEMFRLGLRTIETKSKRTHYRGPIALHATLRDPDCPAARRDPISRRAMAAIPHGNGLTRGAIVATARLVDVVPMVGPLDEDAPIPRALVLDNFGPGTLALFSEADPFAIGLDAQRPYGDFTPGRWAWLLADVEPLAEPVPFKGGQGLTKEWTP